jgi:hypothetical protein
MYAQYNYSGTVKTIWPLTTTLGNYSNYGNQGSLDIPTQSFQHAEMYAGLLYSMHYCCLILITTGMWHILVKLSNINFIKICSAILKLFHASRQTQWNGQTQGMILTGMQMHLEVCHFSWNCLY